MKQTKLKYSRKLAHKIRDIIRSTKNKISIAKFRVACKFSIAKFRVACKFRKALNAKIHLDNTSTSTQSRQMKGAITILRTVMQNGPLQDFGATKEALRIFFNIAKFRVANKYTKVQNAKIHVGCGEYNLDGYINSDIRDLPNVHLVCKAWELDRFAENAAEIYSRHMIEHLTLHEMMTTIRIWYKCLRPGGKIILLCPDMDFHVQQYLNAKWTDEEWDNHFKDSNAKWSFAGFWGHQRGTEDIFQRTSNPNLYWDVHKSGYNKMSMLFFLKRALPEGYIAETKTIPLRDGVGLHLETVITKT